MAEDQICSMCDHPLDSSTESLQYIKEKGLKTYITKSQELNDGKWKMWEGKTTVLVHESCRKCYSARKIPKKRKLNESTEEELLTSYKNFPVPSVSEDFNFNFTDSCLICSFSLKKKYNKISTVTQSKTLLKLLKLVSESENPDADLIERLSYAIHNKDISVKYHTKCFSICLRQCQKKIPVGPSQKELDFIETFTKVCEFIENREKITFTLRDLQSVMGENIIETQKLVKKLKEKYQDDISINQHPGRQTVFYYKIEEVSDGLKECIQGEEISDLQKKEILLVAAQILRKEITERSYAESHQLSDNLLSNVSSDIPSCLQTFLSDLLIRDKNKDDRSFIKRDNIAHAIVSILRPKSFLSKLQLAVATYIHKKTGSRAIVDVLSKLGICSSYYNMHTYETAMKTLSKENDIEDSLVLYVWNTDDKNKDVSIIENEVVMSNCEVDGHNGIDAVYEGITVNENETAHQNFAEYQEGANYEHEDIIGNQIKATDEDENENIADNQDSAINSAINKVYS